MMTMTMMIQRKSVIPIAIDTFRKFASKRQLSSFSTASFYRPTLSVRMSDSSTLPYHLVVGLPALSPTMEVGTLSEWYKSEGDAFHGTY